MSSLLLYISTCYLRVLEVRQAGVLISYLHTCSSLFQVSSSSVESKKGMRREGKVLSRNRGRPRFLLLPFLFADCLLATSHWTCLRLSLMWSVRHWLNQLVPLSSSPQLFTLQPLWWGASNILLVWQPPVRDMSLMACSQGLPVPSGGSKY